jgi:DnaJ-class molecular chaperone
MEQVYMPYIEDILNMFFGGQGQGGRGRGPPQKAKTKPVKKALEVTLEQCYRGEVIRIPH